MTETQALTLAFVGDHAGDAARVLETLPLADAAALFAELPARSGAPVVSAMSPITAAQLLALLPDSLALTLLAEMGPQGAVAILRHLGEPRRSQLIEGLPTITAAASRLLLGFPEDSVGAWTDTEILTLPSGTPVEEALNRLRQEAGMQLQVLHVVDHERRLLGLVALHALLRAGTTASLGTLARPCADVLSAMMPLASATQLSAWSDASALPVIDRSQRLLGVLRHSRLLQIERERRRVIDQRAQNSVAAILAGGYWSVVSGLAASALGLLPPVSRVLPEE